MTMAGTGTAPRRRKIFPHLENEAKQSDQAAAGAEGENSNYGRNADSKSENDAGSSSYDNAKSRRSKKQSSKPSSSSSSSSSSSFDNVASRNGSNDNGAAPTDEAVSAATGAARVDSTPVTIHHHLLPLPLVLTVLVCSGLFWIASFRDVMATGKPILDTLGVLWGQDDADANFVQYTRSTRWFDDSRGWKSKQGGLSTILAATTDANDMGGLFVRKLSGVAGLAFHTSKIWPVVFHSPPQVDASRTASRGRWIGASWGAGHFDPVLALGMVGDVCVSMFYLARLEELKDVGAGGIAMAFILTSLVEAFILGLYLLSRRMNHKTIVNERASARASSGRAGAAAGYDPTEDPNSLPSRIVARTVLIVSSLVSIVSLRDLLFPGTILSFLPRDDIYLEWTGAFLHSPPPDTVEADEHGLEAPLHAGDKLASQTLGIYLSLCCALKLASAFGWSKGSRG
eukprot:CAMPEP_0172539044 /NCGR_PEP_ID=MMETSP1067-20121228/10325_1 /TAXON_ID=265564 ORGANISM="Thalassiosira punctigera, Strain Tpunct2005C2" /NCGR_SAMPLE_ID=MMETSP1067 /ASSEMBLY_ACC=CAM_ASM_000444 /LENGTH=455 /DNA_ID=CAMNT_0013324667 /DNA_START=64 /DNA_END=1427 /DNA_ORIENTATION=-